MTERCPLCPIPPGEPCRALEFACERMGVPANRSKLLELHARPRGPRTETTPADLALRAELVRRPCCPG